MAIVIPDSALGPRRIILDITQEQMAKKADSGHTIVRGIAGSGKSLVWNGDVVD